MWIRQRVLALIASQKRTRRQRRNASGKKSINSSRRPKGIDQLGRKAGQADHPCLKLVREEAPKVLSEREADAAAETWCPAFSKFWLNFFNLHGGTNWRFAIPIEIQCCVPSLPVTAEEIPVPD